MYENDEKSASDLDERDAQILRIRQDAYNRRPGPKVGDFIRYNDGTMRRISYVWRNEQNAPESIQNSDGGSFYLGDGYMDFSGALNPGIPAETLSYKGEKKVGRAWFFHHDYACADNGIDVPVIVSVWDCTLNSDPWHPA